MKMLLSDELSLGSLIEVQSRLEAAGLRTPLRATALQSEASTRRIWVKAENLQPTGSFKIRGATNAVSKLSSVQKARGVVAYSTGNHAQAVALAAQRAGIRATIVMSRDVPNDKIDATLRLGAEVLMAESTSEARRLLAERHAAEHDSILIPPYDDYAVMAGQASIGLEILSECQPSAVIVPIGAGGLSQALPQQLSRYRRRPASSASSPNGKMMRTFRFGKDGALHCQSPARP